MSIWLVTNYKYDGFPLAGCGFLHWRSWWARWIRLVYEVDDNLIDLLLLYMTWYLDAYLH